MDEKLCMSNCQPYQSIEQTYEKSPLNIFNSLFIVKYLLGSCQTLLLFDKHPSIQANRTLYSAPFQHNWIFRHINEKRVKRTGRGLNETEIERRALGGIITKRVCSALKFWNAKPAVQDNEIEFSTGNKSAWFHQICLFMHCLLCGCICAIVHTKTKKKRHKNSTNWQTKYIVSKLDLANISKTKRKKC